MPDEQAVVLLLLLPLAGFLTTAVIGRLSSRAWVIALPGAGDRLRLLQTGRVQNYAPGIAIGLIGMAGAYLVIVGR